MGCGGSTYFSLLYYSSIPLPVQLIKLNWKEVTYVYSFVGNLGVFIYFNKDLNFMTKIQKFFTFLLFSFTNCSLYFLLVKHTSIIKPNFYIFRQWLQFVLLRLCRF